jgi:hypothetical protein
MFAATEYRSLWLGHTTPLLQEINFSTPQLSGTSFSGEVAIFLGGGGS